ncbi:MAG: hypothetical protein Q4C49_07175 [Bacillota bacterium]|nr:hypothetical protein [Bacillota bacterium]
MASILCETYQTMYGEEFLFTESCVSYEIGYHVDCYFRILGDKRYPLHLAIFLLNKERILQSCSVVDIYTYDVKSFLQRTLFRYRKGIRACYKNTNKDPFKKEQ